MQVHHQSKTTAFAGQRVAINIAGVKKTDIVRGDVIAQPDSLKPSMMLDVRLQVLAKSKRTIKNAAMVHLYHGATTMLAKIILLDRDELVAGESALAQLRLTEPLVAKAKDRFVVRFYSPMETIGGGVIIEPIAIRHKRNIPSVLEELTVRENGSVEEQVYQGILIAGNALDKTAELYKKLALDAVVYNDIITTMEQSGEIFSYGKGRLMTMATLRKLELQLEKLLMEFHENNPLLPAMKISEARLKLFRNLDTQCGEMLMEHINSKSQLFDTQSAMIKLKSFTVTYTEKQKKMKEEICQAYKSAGIEMPLQSIILSNYPNNTEDAKQLISALIVEQLLVPLSVSFLIWKPLYDEIIEKSKSHWANQTQMSLAEFRDFWGTSRKYALPILEYFDKQKITKKIEDIRIWL